MLESTYIVSNTTSLLYNSKLILGMTKKISRLKVILSLGLKARPLYHLEVNTLGTKPQGCRIVHQSGSKMILLAVIS